MTVLQIRAKTMASVQISSMTSGVHVLADTLEKTAL